jgi:acyl transferase domain-containing protein
VTHFGQARPPLAVIGIGCRYPGSHGPNELWDSLVAGREEITPTPPYRATVRSGADPRGTRPGVARRGSVGDVSGFDWRAFRMSPRECKYTDPQQRVLLETAWEALEHAGMPLERVAGTRTAVFMGIMWPDYAKLLAECATELAGYATSGVGFALAANRISHFFDLRGPSVSLDVQCASSLIAVHLAAVTIWSGEAELALAGGVSLILTPDSDCMMSRAGILSKQGRCMTFDEQADGFVRGEGAGVIVIKPLAAALADDDQVLAVIRGSASNHDGRSASLTAPSKESQVELIAAACRSADVDPSTLDYVELHGTGTQKGDPLEAHALGEVLGVARPRGRPCLVGSIKTNIGHCEAAAGIASVIKTVLCLDRKQIPPTINHHTMNPNISPAELGIELVTERTPWPAGNKERLAGVTGLSLGGGNAHVVLGEAPRASAKGAHAQPRGAHAARVREPSPTPLVLPVSARTGTALKDLAAAYVGFLRDEHPAQDIDDVCYTAAVRRSHHAFRAVAVAHTADGLAGELEAFAQVAEGTSAQLPNVEEKPTRVVLAFPDRGESEATTLAALVNGDPSIGRAHKRICEELKRAGLSMPPRSREASHPAARFALQAALVDYWARWNIIADAAAGEGVGALTAAYATHSHTLEQTVAALQELIAERQSEADAASTPKQEIAVQAYETGAVLDDARADLCGSLLELSRDAASVILQLVPSRSLEVALTDALAGETRRSLLAPSSRAARETMPWGTASELYTRGCQLSWTPLFERPGTVVSLPLYPWDRERLWMENDLAAEPTLLPGSDYHSRVLR